MGAEAQKLRQAVLQSAIEGKLVAQDTNDEPASVLLERIVRKKERLIRETRIRNERALPPVAADEAAFEIPENWQWARLGQLGTLTRGSGIKRGEVVESGGHACVRYGELYTTYHGPFSEVVSHTTKDVFDKAKKAKTGDILMALTGENDFDIALGRLYIGEDEIAYGGDMTNLRLLCLVPQFVAHVLNSSYGIGQKRMRASGDIIVHISNDKLATIPVPVPPVAEQHRIVAKIAEIMSLIDEFEKLEDEVTALEAELPKKLRWSLLQAAFEGKLVEQKPTEEATATLLKQVAREKQQMVTDKIIRRQKDLPTICQDNEPYEIPETWQWAPLRNIVFNRGQITPNIEFCYIDIGSIDNKRQKLSSQETIVAPDKAPSRARKPVAMGDILYSTVRPYLHNMCIIDRVFSRVPIASTGFAALVCHSGIINRFVHYYLMSPHFDSYANDTANSKGVAYPAINNDRLYRAPVPIAPTSEQCRIADKLDEVLPLVEALESRMSHVEEETTQ